MTAGVAAPAYAGIPVTHRELASAVAFVTGHEDPAKPESALDWEALAAFPGTLVVYMGVRQLESIAARLIAAGRDAGRARGGDRARDAARAAGGDGDARDDRREGRRRRVSARPRSPCSARWSALRERLEWFERRPLAGLTVAVTRARAQASELASRLRALGAAVVEAPAIRIVPLDGPAPDVGDYDLVCLTSPNGVRLLFERLARGRARRARAGRDAAVAAIGPGTAAALREPRGDRRRGAGAVRRPRGWSRRWLDVPVERALVARAAEARDVLPDALRERGAEVDVRGAVRDGRRAARPTSSSPRVERADYVTFTSSSTVAIPARRRSTAPCWSAPRLVSIGPVTSAALRERGLEPARRGRAARHRRAGRGAGERCGFVVTHGACMPRWARCLRLR